MRLFSGFFERMERFYTMAQVVASDQESFFNSGSFRLVLEGCLDTYREETFNWLWYRNSRQAYNKRPESVSFLRPKP